MSGGERYYFHGNLNIFFSLQLKKRYLCRKLSRHVMYLQEQINSYAKYFK
jgi:hypothetical protein